MNLAVIKTGGKQYVVTPDKKLKVEKLDIANGQAFDFSEVLLLADSKSIKLGEPFLKNVKVKASVIAQGKADKVIGHHYKPKTRNKKKFGHRQPFTEVKIEKIDF